MNSTGRLSFAVFNRRRVCSLMASAAVSAVIAKLPLESVSASEAVSDCQGYVVFNGWILTCQDAVAMELPSDAIRLQ